MNQSIIKDKIGTADIYHGDCRDMLSSMPDSCADLIVSSPPYSMGREYEDRSAGLKELRKLHESIFADMYRILKPSGSICWQVGSHVAKGEVMPRFINEEEMDRMKNFP